MTDRIKRWVLRHLSDRRYVPRQIRHLSRELGVAAEQYEQFRTSVQQLISEGQVVLGSTETIALPPPGPQMIGTFRLARGGFGFVTSETAGHGDLFVPAPNTLDALTGDLVRAAVQPRPQRGRPVDNRYVGRVVEIIQRADRHYVGNLLRRGSRWMVRVDAHRLHDPVIIRDPTARDAREGDKVVIEILNYPQDDTPAEGVITEVLGKQGEPDVETLAVMRAFGLAEQFPDGVVEKARVTARQFDATVAADVREDLTSLHVVTIDPPDARDFDDAISITRLDDSEGAAYELGVHIADVAHFVPAGGVLDEEAATRGNSAYLPRKVIPMLPELLSNGVCSLQEGVDRLCKTAFIRFDADGAVCDQRIARGVIRSAKRLTYREAQALIDGNVREARKHSGSDPKYPRRLIELLQLMNELTHLIRRRRLQSGMIVLDLPTVDLIFDDAGRVVDAEPEDDSFTHTIIEMFMVEANEAVARLFDAMHVPILRRIHPDPPAHDLKQLRAFARVAGYNVPAHPTRLELQQLLDAVRGRPAQHPVHLAVLKTLSRAEYSPLHIGHFALASEHYAHFTSPIRRYPDLVVHRALDAYLDLVAAKPRKKGGKRQLGKALREDARVPDEQRLAEIGTHCSASERNAEAAERELRQYLVLELLNEHLGEDFDGTVTGVTGSGLFVQIDRYLVDGFIPSARLPGSEGRGGDRWRLNATTGALVADRSGKTISIGDRFVVRIAKVDSAGRQLDLVIVPPPAQGAPPAKAKRRQPKGAAESHRQSMKLKKIRKQDQRGRRRHDR